MMLRGPVIESARRTKFVVWPSATPAGVDSLFRMSSIPVVAKKRRPPATFRDAFSVENAHAAAPFLTQQPMCVPFLRTALGIEVVGG
jgi:hypothetical protein